MSAILFDLNNPDHLASLELVVMGALHKHETQSKMERQFQDVRWTTQDVCRYFGAEEKPIKPATVYKYIREFYLPYTPGRPNLFWKSEVVAWAQERQRNKRAKRVRT